MRQAGHIQNQSGAPDLKGSQNAYGTSCIFLVQRGLHVCSAVAGIAAGIEGNEG
jgi:hypothetical protein